MKNYSIAFLCLLSLFSLSAFAQVEDNGDGPSNSSISEKLSNCDFGFAQISFEHITLEGFPVSKDIQVYESLTKQSVAGIDLPFKKIPATVQKKRNKVVISYPIFNVETDELEVNQTITVNLKKEVNRSETSTKYSAEMNTLGLKDKGTCTFSL